MNSLEGSVDQPSFEERFRNPGALAAIDRFAACTDSGFECSTIVGRRFEDIGDHAAFLRDGGCARIIETLTAA
jgi:hypothetical protein